jgi:hypothetical protein
MEQIRQVPLSVDDIGGYGSVYDVIGLVKGIWGNNGSHWPGIVHKNREWSRLPTHNFGTSHPSPVAPVDVLVKIASAVRGKVPEAPDDRRSFCADLVRRRFECDEGLARDIDEYIAPVVSDTGVTSSAEQPLAVIDKATSLSDVDDRQYDGNEYCDMFICNDRGVVDDYVALRRVPRSGKSKNLRPVEGLASIRLPPQIGRRCGAYCGVKGEFTAKNGTVWIHIKFGKHDRLVVERVHHHECEFPDWCTVWAGAATSILCLPRDIEDTLKHRFSMHPAMRALKGHQTEEFAILKTGPEGSRSSTRSHAKWSSSSPSLSSARTPTLPVTSATDSVRQTLAFALRKTSWRSSA